MPYEGIWNLIRGKGVLPWTKAYWQNDRANRDRRKTMELREQGLKQAFHKKRAGETFREVRRQGFEKWKRTTLVEMHPRHHMGIDDIPRDDIYEGPLYNNEHDRVKPPPFINPYSHVKRDLKRRVQYDIRQLCSASTHQPCLHVHFGKGPSVKQKQTALQPAAVDSAMSAHRGARYPDSRIDQLSFVPGLKLADVETSKPAVMSIRGVLMTFDDRIYSDSDSDAVSETDEGDPADKIAAYYERQKARFDLCESLCSPHAESAPIAIPPRPKRSEW